MKYEDLHSVHFIGIGGIGMSAIARFLQFKGKKVTGYDRTQTALTDRLAAEGVEVYFEADPGRLEAVDLVIYTPAIPADHPELVKTREMGLPLMKRAEFLGLLSQSYRTIAIAGTHGKTTTTGLVTHLLKDGGRDVTAFIGGISRNFNTNFVYGESEWMVVEADEFDRSFLHLSPDIAVITSMDPDHLDIYGSGDDLKNAFGEFADRIKPGGTLFINEKLPRLKPEGVRVISYGAYAGECHAGNVVHEGRGVRFDLRLWRGTSSGFELNFPGKYNLENAVAALSVASILGISKPPLQRALKSAKGVKRRFEEHLRTERTVVIDDYAHHPEEIRAVLKAVRKQHGKERKLIVIFQPHLYSRTQDFYEGFAETLSLADEVILVDIYPAREEPIPGVTSELIFERLDVDRKVRCQRDEIVPTLQAFKSVPSVVMTVGAGDIDTQVKPVVEEVKTW